MQGGEGAIMNSKAEFNRCHIPRLQLEEEEQEGAREREEQVLAKQMEEELIETLKNGSHKGLETRQGSYDLS